MSVFPYNCKFRTVNLPDYDIAWLRINWKGTKIKYEKTPWSFSKQEKGEAKVNAQEPEDETFYHQGIYLFFA